MSTDAWVGVDDRLEHEIEELKFLVGTACSRAINLLMQPAPNQAELQDEMAFLGAKASRLAELLSGPPVEALPSAPPHTSSHT
jgi:hypothetical protein